jgi:hypothetical protein
MQFSLLISFSFYFCCICNTTHWWRYTIIGRNLLLRYLISAAQQKHFSNVEKVSFLKFAFSLTYVTLKVVCNEKEGGGGREDDIRS